MVDIRTGNYSNGVTIKNNDLVECKYHPDTQVLLEGILPNWSHICEKIIEISSYIPQVRYMGYDVIITDGGFKIIEINSHPGISYIQYYYPLLTDEASKDFFRQLIEEKKSELKNI